MGRLDAEHPSVLRLAADLALMRTGEISAYRPPELGYRGVVLDPHPDRSFSDSGLVSLNHIS